MKIKTKSFYFSIDKEGFYCEIGNLDKPTSLISIGFITSKALTKQNNVMKNENSIY